MSGARLARAATLTGYAGLLLLLLAWFGWLHPPRVLPVPLVLAVLLVPLSLPLWGLLRGRPYTHAWTALLSLPYFVHGVGEAYAEPAVRILASAEMALSVTLFLGATLYARLGRRPLEAPI